MHNIEIEFDFDSIHIIIKRFIIVIIIIIVVTIILLLLYVTDNIQYIICACVCVYACVRKRLVVASQWTCCYADALLFRVG